MSEASEVGKGAAVRGNTDHGDARRIRICIVDDHPAVLVGLRSMLSCNDEFDVVGTFSSGAALLHAAKELLPDVLLLDLRMPGLGGPQCLAPVATGGQRHVCCSSPASRWTRRSFMHWMRVRTGLCGRVPRRRRLIMR